MRVGEVIFDALEFLYRGAGSGAAIALLCKWLMMHYLMRPTGIRLSCELGEIDFQISYLLRDAAYHSIPFFLVVWKFV